MRVTSKVTLVLSMGVVSGILLLLLVGLGERRPAVDTLSPAAAAPQAPAQDVVDSPLPLPPVPARPVEEIPTLEITVITPPPDGGVIVLPPVTPGQIYALPTFTPFPTRTPRPTPTPRPWSEVAVTPLPKPPDTPEGYLLYALPSKDYIFGSAWTQSKIDAAGKLASDSTLPLKEVAIELTYPQSSPNEAYILFLRPSTEAAGVPYIYETSTHRMRPLFDHPEQLEEFGVDRFDDIAGLPFGWHPDSRHVLFWAATSSYAGLWLVDVETGERTVIRMMQDPPPQGAAVSPDGQRIAYAVNETGSSHVETAFVNGAPDKRLESVSVGRLYGWSPDGKSVLVLGGYEREKDSSEQADMLNEGPLALLNPDTLEIERLQLPMVTNWPFQASVSPDGRFVAAVGLRPNERFTCYDADLPREKADTCDYEGTSIYIQDLAGGTVTELVPGISPTWSPDGSMLAFLSDLTGKPEVWTIRVDGTELQQVTSDNNGKRSAVVWISNKEGEDK
jgi:dipeptidyl aminopeptidase/acylaminoacyl peptidase